ncbi:MAG TPA: tyrosine-type recombinase/integrase [Candidatus Saccharimonadales bacterium]|nr:tyrosine-type recombinase/integrase [Candidatus Saccharimonadales bacterium]
MFDIAALVDEFLEYCEIEKNLSLLTIRDYRHYLKFFIAWQAENSPISAPSDITVEVVRKYRVYLAHFVSPNGNLPLKKVTQNYYVIALRSFLKYLIRKDLAVVSPDKIELPKTESRSLKFLDREQLERLLSQPEISKESGLRDKALMETLFSTGLRVSELCKLNRDQINVERKEFGVIGKGGRARVVFLSDRATLWIERYLAARVDQSKALFIRYAGNQEAIENMEKLRLTTRSVQRMIEKYVRKARLPIKITPHGIRHTFATDLLMNGADLRSVQELLGHKNVSTTQIYTHVTNAQLHDVHKAFHGRSINKT